MQEIGGLKAGPVERLFEPSQICTPIFCFLETTTYGSAKMAGLAEPCNSPHLRPPHLTTPQALSRPCRFCTPILVS